MKTTNKVKCITINKDVLQYFGLETNKEYTINCTGSYSWASTFNYLPKNKVDCVTLKELSGGYIPQEYFELVKTTVSIQKELKDFNEIERLEYAKLNYPIGTIYKALYNSGKTDNISETVSTEIKSGYSNNALAAGVDYIYSGKTNTWAEIVKDEIKLSINSRVRWKVGDNLKTIHNNITYCWNNNGKNQKESSIKNTDIYEVGEISKTQPDLFRFLVDIKCNNNTWYMENDFELAYIPNVIEHPYIVGNWYKLFSVNKSWIGFYIKFKGIESGIVKSSENIYENKHYITNSSFNAIGYYTPVEILLVDIQQYLPDGHVDKFIKSNNIITSFNEYKIGSIVKTLQTEGNNTENNNHIKSYDKIGELLEIEDFEKNNQGYISAICKKGYVIRIQQHPEKFKLVTVVLKEDKFDQWIPQVGEYAILEKYNRNSNFSNIKTVGCYFLIEEIYEEIWLRPESGIATGINIRDCRKALDHEILKHLQDAINTQNKNISINLPDSYVIGVDPYNINNSCFPDKCFVHVKNPLKEIKLLKPKDDKRFDTSINKIESVTIQLKQKSKSIKF